MYFTYISNVKLKHVKLLLLNILSNITFKYNLKGQPCFYSKVKLYLDNCQTWIMFAHLQYKNNLITI
jgi:hypothetical protein